MFLLSRIIISLVWSAWLLEAALGVRSDMPPTSQSTEMTLWKDRSPSWHASHTVGENNEQWFIEDLYRFANSLFNWVRTQKNCLTKDGTLLVAAVYDHTSKTVYSSTIPRGRRAQDILNKASDFAPIWWHRAKQWPAIAGGWKAQFGPFLPQVPVHAEDGAYYLLEKEIITDPRKANKLPPLTEQELDNAHYSTDSSKDDVMVAVWGVYGSNSDAIKTEKGRPIDLCSREDGNKDWRGRVSRKPCTWMADELHVHRVEVEEPPEQKDEDDNGDNLQDADANNQPDACVAPGRRAFLPREHYKAWFPRDNNTQACFNITEPDPSVTGPVGKPSTVSGPASTQNISSPVTSIFVPTQNISTSTQQTIKTTNPPSTKPTSTSKSTSTSAPTPTIAAWVGNLSTLDIGNAEDGNGGKDLAKEMFTKLRGACDQHGCKSDHAIMDNVEVAIAGGEEPLKPAMYLQEATFSSLAILEQMLSVGISSWVAALNNEGLKLCKDVEYEAEADETGSGCGQGPISPSRLRRKTNVEDGTVLWQRDESIEKRCKDDCGTHTKTCHYMARMCNAPNEISKFLPIVEQLSTTNLQLLYPNIHPHDLKAYLTEHHADMLQCKAVVMADGKDPYANHLNIGVLLEKTEASDGFDCEAMVGLLTSAAVVLAPELLPADALEGVEMESICGIINDAQDAFKTLTSLLPAPT
ncbi:putative Class V protein [Seiridium unicorne]|uniref:Class V protein n=1 Tax=Seiridium unicorne TaxID=138068 RepID=A0ABR2UEB6_9PEZI